MRFEAWLMLEDGKRCDCAGFDIAHIGARINIPNSDAIPDNFVLFLAENDSARRRCRVIWRNPRELGVKFETWLDERMRAVKRFGAGTEVAPKETTSPIASNGDRGMPEPVH